MRPVSFSTACPPVDNSALHTEEICPPVAAKAGTRLVRATSYLKPMVMVPLAAALVPVVRASSCTSVDLFKSPVAGVKYSKTSGCGFTDDYLHRFVKACGAIPISYEVSLLWDVVRYSLESTLRRDSNAVAPQDAAFEPCIEAQQKRQDGTTADYTGIIVGVVVGACVVIGGAALAIKYCCARSNRRQAEAARAAQSAEIEVPSIVVEAVAS